MSIHMNLVMDGIVMVFNATFNNISVITVIYRGGQFQQYFSYNSYISWRSVLLMEETGGPGENQSPVASH